ncbi:MAG: hypothetical protein P8Z79_25910 [Sedimentisphaerales bacterium]
MSCQKVGSAASTPHEVHTINVGPGGVYLQAADGAFRRGDLLKLVLSIPAEPGRLKFGGKMSGFARVLRTDNIRESSTEGGMTAPTHGVALQFCRPLKLSL